MQRSRCLHLQLLGHVFFEGVRNEASISDQIFAHALRPHRTGDETGTPLDSERTADWSVKLGRAHPSTIAPSLASHTLREGCGLRDYIAPSSLVVWLFKESLNAFTVEPTKRAKTDFLTLQAHIFKSIGDTTVADLGGVRGVQKHPPLAASNVFLHK